MSDQTPVLWAYCPRMMVALAGQHSGVETKAFEKLMPLVFSTERVFGMYLRSSLRMSSARMKTKLGLMGFVWAVVGGLPVVVGELPSALKKAAACVPIPKNRQARTSTARSRRRRYRARLNRLRFERARLLVFFKAPAVTRSWQANGCHHKPTKLTEL